MPNGSQSHTMVTKAVIIDATTIRVSVGVDAFLPNELVEISGYVTQLNGAFAYFDEFTMIDGKLGSTVALDVDAKLAGDSEAFQKGQDVTVFVRVSKVWVTVLAEGQDQQPEISPRYAGSGSVWGRVKGVAGPEKYSPDTWGGNQPASAMAAAAQPAADASPGPDGPKAS
jgi:hypothetical protein